MLFSQPLARAFLGYCSSEGLLTFLMRAAAEDHHTTPTTNERAAQAPYSGIRGVPGARWLARSGLNQGVRDHVLDGLGYARGMATNSLTPRQQQVLDLWLDGKTYKEVAAECGISPETVNPHLKAVRKKLGATGISRDALRAVSA